MDKTSSYVLLELTKNKNKVVLTVQTSGAREALTFFRSKGYPLDRNSYLKVGDTTYCVAVHASQD